MTNSRNHPDPTVDKHDIKMLLDSVEQVADKYAGDRTVSRFNKEYFQELGKIGFFRAHVPQEYGGQGFPFYAFTAGISIVASRDPSSALGFGIHATAAEAARYGLNAHTRRLHDGMIRGEIVGCFALTEDLSGSDAINSMRTTYETDGDNCLLTGKKRYITNGLSADAAVLFARDRHNTGRVSAFLFELSDGEAFRRGSEGTKHTAKGSETAELIFDRYAIPLTSLVGREGDGDKIAKGALNGGRIIIAAEANGISEYALGITLEYAKARGLIKLPNIQERFRAMNSALTRSKSNVRQAGEKKDASRHAYGKDHAGHAAITKYVASEVAGIIAKACIDLSGANGLIGDGNSLSEELHRALHDAEIMRVGEGPNTLLKDAVIPAFLKRHDDHDWLRRMEMPHELYRKVS